MTESPNLHVKRGHGYRSPDYVINQRVVEGIVFTAKYLRKAHNALKLQIKEYERTAK